MYGQFPDEDTTFEEEEEDFAKSFHSARICLKLGSNEKPIIFYLAYKQKKN